MEDRGAVGLAVLAAVAALVAPGVPPAAALLVLALWTVRRHPALLALALAVFVGGRAHDSTAALAAPTPQRVAGEAELVSDPEDRGFSTRAVLELDGRRYVAEVPSGKASGLRRALTGDRVQVRGRPSPLRGAPPGWVRSQHLAGRLRVAELGEPRPGSPWHRAANAVHRTLRAGSASFGDARPLYLGLVIGDDRGQSDLRQFRFEASGLTHLLAVSGSNVAFVLAVIGPALRRLGPRARVAVGVGAVGLFVLVTRAEPSVLRAGVMASLGLVALAAGRAAPARRVLALAVTGLLAADPLLVHSLGFQLSVAATAGVVVWAPRLVARLPGPEWCRAPIAVTAAAQLATMPLLLGLRGGIPSVATPANLLAGPAAGAVMVLGVTVGLLAGLVGEGTAGVIQLPARALVGWIDGVATLGSQMPLPMLSPLRLVALAAAVAVVVLLRGPSSHVVSHSSLLQRLGMGFGATLGVLCGSLAMWPAQPPPGAHPLGDSATLSVGGCGGQVVVLDGAGSTRRLLAALTDRGVRRIDLLVIGGSRAEARVALVLAEQFSVRRTLTAAERGPPGVEPIGLRVLSVGGVVVHAARPSTASAETGQDRPLVMAGPERGRCSVAP